MYDIFISYAREDLHRVEPIVRELLNLGWRVFIDRNILPGSYWRGEIDKALKETCCVLVVWSSASVNDRLHPWVHEEAECGRQREILVPLCLDGVEQPRGFGSVQSVDLSGWNGMSVHPGFLLCIKGIKAKIKAEFDRIMDLLQKPATVADAFILAEKLPFRGNDQLLFEQLRREYDKDNPDFELLSRIRQFLSDYDPENTKAENYCENQMTPWHHLDKHKIKQAFRKLWYKKTRVKVFFIERNSEAYSYCLHNILEKYCCREFKTVCTIKGVPSDHVNIFDAEGEFAHFIDRYFDINVSAKQNFENIQFRILDTQVHFVVQSIDDFSYANFIKYYELWVSLEPKEPLFLFFYVQPGSLADDIEPLENYCLCRYDDHEKVDGEAFQDFFSDPKSPLKNNNPDICNSPPMTFQKAVKELEFCLKEP
jgi:hypothetical protein